jgi:hypothetical protein
MNMRVRQVHAEDGIALSVRSPARRAGRTTLLIRYRTADWRGARHAKKTSVTQPVREAQRNGEVVPCAATDRNWLQQA